MLKLGDLVVYNNGVKDYMAEITAIFPETDEYEIKFSLSSLVPNRMLVHEKTLEPFVPYGHKKCECDRDWET
jgi:hypothetical protein